ncbi:hypothetical protein AVEN_130586-1 [Araneus ventricosus]|uniref:Uncharacterized protein n=1 Tax=Araneus ventricosus TaxID=182803 RepID=A0A4Y2HIW9_ARAVE|nr:hypothetical protein AVEN_130586-1 [Araneus ventricosus]
MNTAMSFTQSSSDRGSELRGPFQNSPRVASKRYVDKTETKPKRKIHAVSCRNPGLSLLGDITLQRGDANKKSAFPELSIRRIFLTVICFQR